MQKGTAAKISGSAALQRRRGRTVSFWPAPASAQVAGRVSLKAEVYALVLALDESNDVSAAIGILDADSGHLCAGNKLCRIGQGLTEPLLGPDDP